MEKFQTYRSYFLDEIIKKLLLEAKNLNQIDSEINIDLFIRVNFENLDIQIWYDEVIREYSQDEILKYLVIHRLQGIATQKDLF